MNGGFPTKTRFFIKFSTRWLGQPLNQPAAIYAALCNPLIQIISRTQSVHCNPSINFSRVFFTPVFLVRAVAESVSNRNIVTHASFSGLSQPGGGYIKTRKSTSRPCKRFVCKKRVITGRAEVYACEPRSDTKLKLEKCH